MDRKCTTALFCNMNNPVTRETYMIAKNLPHKSDDLKPTKKKVLKEACLIHFRVFIGFRR